MVVIEKTGIATLPLVVKILFVACVAMLVGNALVLIPNLKIVESADSRVERETPSGHRLLKPFLVDAAIVQPEHLPGRPLADLDPALMVKGRYIDMASPALAMSERGRVNDDLRLGVRGPEEPMRLHQSIPAALQEGPASALQGNTDRSYAHFRSTALLGMIVNTAAIAVLVLFYLLIQRSFARQGRVDETLKSHNRSLEVTVAQRTRELSELSGHLIQVAEEEKAKLARDLHDELGASLTAMKFDMTYVVTKLKDSAPPLADRLQRAIDTLRSTFDLKQRLVQDLWPTMLDHLGLAIAVREHCNEFTLRTGVPCVADIAEDLDMDPRWSIALYRVVQESLTNVAKHAQASHVTVVLRREREGITLQVCDDGIGISVDARNKSRSHGVIGMRERISQLSGKFAISSRPEKGTVVKAFIPLAEVRSDQEQIFPASVLLPSGAAAVARVSISTQNREAGMQAAPIAVAADADVPERAQKWSNLPVSKLTPRCRTA